LMDGGNFDNFIYLEMDVEPKFREKQISGRKKKFDENIENEIMKSPRELFRIFYFLFIIDKAITILQNRFEQFKTYEDIFCFLFSIKKLKSLDCILLKKKMFKS